MTNERREEGKKRGVSSKTRLIVGKREAIPKDQIIETETTTTIMKEGMSSELQRELSSLLPLTRRSALGDRGSGCR